MGSLFNFTAEGAPMNSRSPLYLFNFFPQEITVKLQWNSAIKSKSALKCCLQTVVTQRQIHFAATQKPIVGRGMASNWGRTVVTVCLRNYRKVEVLSWADGTQTVTLFWMDYLCLSMVDAQKQTIHSRATSSRKIWSLLFKYVFFFNYPASSTTKHNVHFFLFLFIRRQQMTSKTC